MKVIIAFVLFTLMASSVLALVVNDKNVLTNNLTNVSYDRPALFEAASVVDSQVANYWADMAYTQKISYLEADAGMRSLVLLACSEALDQGETPPDFCKEIIGGVFNG